MLEVRKYKEKGADAEKYKDKDADADKYKDKDAKYWEIQIYRCKRVGNTKKKMQESGKYKDNLQQSGNKLYLM